MPTNPDGSLREFTQQEIDAMEIETCGIRDRSHYVESRRVDENVMTRVFFTKFSERFNFCELVIGNSALFNDGGGVARLSRLIPNAQFGRHHDNDQIVATRIEDIRNHNPGIDNNLRFPVGERAVITVGYEQARWVLDRDASTLSERHRFTSRGAASSAEAEAFTLPGACFKYVTDNGGGPHGTQVPFNISFVRPVRNFTVTWHFLPNALYTTGGALFERLYAGSGDGIPWLGTCNKRVLVLPSIGTFAPGKVLLDGVEDRTIMSPLAEPELRGLRWDVTFKFKYTPRGWLDLMFFDPANPTRSGWHTVSNNGTYYTPGVMPDNTGLYNLRDHNELWNPAL